MVSSDFSSCRLPAFSKRLSVEICLELEAKTCRSLKISLVSSLLSFSLPSQIFDSLMCFGFLTSISLYAELDCFNSSNFTSSLVTHFTDGVAKLVEIALLGP